MSYQHFTILGNLTRDPEIRVLPKGTSVASFGLASNRKFKNGDGSDGEEVLFIDVEAWGKQAETVAKYFSKGKPMLAAGRLKLDAWDDKKTGEKRSKIKMVLEGFSFVGKTEGDGGRGEAGTGGEQKQKAKPADDTDTPY